MYIFVKRLNEALKNKSFSQNAFSKVLGVTSRTVNRWCLGQRQPDYETLVKICKILDETPNHMLGFDD